MFTALVPFRCSCNSATARTDLFKCCPPRNGLLRLRSVRYIGVFVFSFQHCSQSCPQCGQIGRCFVPGPQHWKHVAMQAVILFALYMFSLSLMCAGLSRLHLTDSHLCTIRGLAMMNFHGFTCDIAPHALDSAFHALILSPDSRICWCLGCLQSLAI